MHKTILSCLFTVFFAFSFAQKENFVFPPSQKEKNPKEYDPWFTGPLLCPSANCLDPGLFNIQPYLFYTETFPDSGSHSHSFEEANYVQYGLLNFLDITFFFHLFYNDKDHKHDFGFGDSTLMFGFQVLRQIPHTLTPSIRITLGENFPTGKFRNLDPDKLSVDSLGSGSFKTKVSLNVSKIVYWIKYHPIALRLYIPFSVSSLVLVKGFNSYGGGYNTYGKVRPPYSFSTVFAFEVSLTQRWVYSMDFWYQYDSKTTFKGKNPGTNLDGTIASCDNLASQNLSISSSIEYNINENFGFISGVWFTVLTKNSSDFISYSTSFTYTF